MTLKSALLNAKHKNHERVCNENVGIVYPYYKYFLVGNTADTLLADNYVCISMEMFWFTTKDVPGLSQWQ